MENKAWNDLVKHIDKSKVFLEDLKQSNKNKQIAFLADATINDLNMIYSLAKKACEGQPVADTESGQHLALPLPTSGGSSFNQRQKYAKK
ncbi:MAG: hypothetical protein ACOC2M_01620 [bacterium]